MRTEEQWSIPRSGIPPGRVIKFHIFWRGRTVEAFLINFGGNFHAYVNHCIHAGTPLDWWPNEFFSQDGKFLICGTHGSRFDPATGDCAGGPCTGGSLFRLQVMVNDTEVVVHAA